MSSAEYDAEPSDKVEWMLAIDATLQKAQAKVDERAQRARRNA